jgi:hypothetical protein
VLNNYIGLIVPPRLGDNRAHQYGFAAAWLASNLEEPRAGGEPLSKNAIVLPKPLETGLVWTVNQVLPSPDLGRLQTINTVYALLVNHYGKSPRPLCNILPWHIFVMVPVTKSRCQFRN